MALLLASDIRVDIRIDATPLGSLLLTSGTFEPGLGMESFQVAGKATSEMYQTTADCSLNIDHVPQTPEVMRLLNIIRAKANRQHPNHAEFRDAVIDAEFVADFAEEGRGRALMSNCMVTGGAIAFQGGNARTSQPLTFTAPDWRYRT
jgi:hypothetical protein